MQGMYMDGNMASSSDMRYFNWLVLLTQLVGVASVVITAVWMGHFRGGFAWQSDPDHEFNYHPLFMVIGMVFLYADGILVYRVFRNDQKLLIKVVHAVLHVAALVFAAVGLKAVFDSHNLKAPQVTNLYSLHSWLGLFVVVAFGLQWVLGFLSFLWPKFGMAFRSTYMSYHRFWGVCLLILATAVALMGITEKAIFSKSYGANPDQPGKEGVLVNCLGVGLVTFTGLAVYLVTKPEYQRPPDQQQHELLE